ncbi:MAG: hypothetical protein WAZ99_08320 [Rectinemataceae bacterium]
MKSAFRYSCRGAFLYLFVVAFILVDPRECFAQSAPPPASGQAGMLEFHIRTGYSQTAIPAPTGAAPQASTLPGPQSGAAQSGAVQGASQNAPQNAAQAVRALTWSPLLIKTAPPGAPVEVRLVGPNLIALVQVVPFERSDALLDLVVQGQVWLKMPDGSVAYQSTLKTLILEVGGTLFFYPLGVDARGAAPVAVEIVVIRVAK